VNARQPTPAAAQALRQFFAWALSPQGGNSAHFMRTVGFVSLPPAIERLSQAQIARIH
jgi:phosphate transport system substrate-binding protein